MLKISVQLSESFNNETNEFVSEYFELELEHSLVSLSNWESEFEKPFLTPTNKTSDEVLAYVRCMILTPDYPSDILDKLSNEDMETINAHIGKKMTATWFNEPKGSGRSREQITSELIYYWLASNQIPWEAQYWHLNRLFTLIKVFNAKNSKEKKMSRGEAMAQQRSLNEQRRAQFGTKG